MTTPDSDPAAATAPILSPRERRFLKYWALNMSLASSNGMPAPGFSYDSAEWRRLLTIARSVPGAATTIWLAVTVVVYLALAAMGMIGAGAIISLLWPDPASVPETGFFALLGMVIMLLLGLGMPLSLGLGGAAGDRFVAAPFVEEDPADAALVAKIRRQFRRIGAIAAMTVVPIALFMTALGSKAEWVPTILNAVAAASALLGLIASWLERRRLSRERAGC
jgi:hypothetical protein